MANLLRFTRTWTIWLLLWLFVALACNVPVGQQSSPGLSPTVTTTESAVTTPATPAGTPAAPATIPILETAIVPQEEEATLTVLPTFTSIAPPTLAATPAATASVTSAPPGQAATTTQTPVSQGPLDFSYTITWQLTAANPFMAVARVTIQATGGSGVYTYYHDDILRSGPIFEYNWAACQGNPGSLRVDSSDGQSVRKSYFETAPCPTPTPTPSS